MDAIVDYYDFYRQIMAFHEASSRAAIVHLDIDAMRANPAAEIPKMIRICGFEWSDAYLGPDVLAECASFGCSHNATDSLTSDNQGSCLTRAQLVEEVAAKLEVKGYLSGGSFYG